MIGQPPFSPAGLMRRSIAETCCYNAKLLLCYLHRKLVCTVDRLSEECHRQEVFPSFRQRKSGMRSAARYSLYIQLLSTAPWHGSLPSLHTAHHFPKVAFDTGTARNANYACIDDLGREQSYDTHACTGLWSTL